MMSILHRSYSAISTLILLHLATVSAQHNAPLQAPSPTPSSASAASSTVFLSPAAFTSTANYFESDNPASGNNSNSHAVLNYYFLLLAGFVIVVIFLYWVLARKRKRRFAEAHSRSQHALAADLERWPGRGGPRGLFATTRTGRWHVLRPTRPQEGLNEHGEAPPAYVAKPEPVHRVDTSDAGGGAPSSAGSLSPEWIEMAGKPPDYQERPHA